MRQQPACTYEVLAGDAGCTTVSCDVSKSIGQAAEAIAALQVHGVSM
jgi:hypothetical protein